MSKVLVLGGTRFFGKKLVHLLIQEGADVTVATRGHTVDSFGDQVKRLQLDRTDPEQLRAAVADTEWDVVYDNICYHPQEAFQACEIFVGKVKRYIFTSTLSVYPFGQTEKYTEGAFSPYTYAIPADVPKDIAYGEGKRLAEAVLFQNASFPVCAVRFPIVLGMDDYTKRLHFHIEHIQRGQPIGLPNPQASISFITSDEAARFLFWLKNQHFEGPVNACSDGALSISEIIRLIEEKVAKQAVIVDTSDSEQDAALDDAHRSPFGIPDDWGMDTSKAAKHGFKFDSIHDWYPKLLEQIIHSNE
ncbi:NAD-dependent epimerase/dehydratase family protein [Paenibacillus sp.]|uniref:NAD-dependent epimerase/dehydratase family protein n=1 Tax=unclassified Paenibacillus TaxID=185978 RepID=UPI0034638BF4